MHQSVWAFYASHQSCADCHNKLQNLSGNVQWKVGDLMGAQVIAQNIKLELSNVQRTAIIQNAGLR